MTTTALLTNRNSHGDFIREALAGSAAKDEPIFIATAFFTDHALLDLLARRSGHVRLVVRLGFPTSPKALQDALSDRYVDVRFFTRATFHPKLYIFGDRLAYVGSANLTAAAVISNQEILVAIPAEDPRLADLSTLFGEYWDQAEVLTPEALDRYRKIYNQHKAISAGIAELEKQVATQIGDVEFSNIERPGKKRKSKENLFTDSYRKTYQEAVTAFMAIRDVYVADGRRKVQDEDLPLRLEIDSFFSFVRDRIATGERWREAPVGWTHARRQDLANALDRWHKTRWEHLESTIVTDNYPRLLRAVNAPDLILAASDDALFDALLTLHSFHDSRRFHLGGIPGLRQAFLGSNEAGRIRESLAYLIHGQGDVVSRMADLIFDTDYKLSIFGRANVQELVGWYNKEDLPVVNGRTTKILRHFGFDVRQL